MVVVLSTLFTTITTDNRLVTKTTMNLKSVFNCKFVIAAIKVVAPYSYSNFDDKLSRLVIIKIIGLADSSADKAIMIVTIIEEL